jgi:hypothetical protein
MRFLSEIWIVKKDKPYTPLPFSFVVFMMHLAGLRRTGESESLMVWGKNDPARVASTRQSPSLMANISWQLVLAL